MNVLGVADNHDSGAALVINGELIAAVNQERLDRVKGSGAFPWSAIDAVLAAGGLRERDIHRIVFGTAFTPAAILRAFPAQHRAVRSKEGQFSPLLHAYILYQSALRDSGLHAIEIEACKSILEKRMAERPFGDVEVEMLDHHSAHAHGAYRTQPHDRALILTLDAMGDGTTATVSLGRDGQVDHLWRQSGTAAINTFYSRVTQRLGFTANRHEGKITGLAAFAEPPPALVTHFRQQIRFAQGRFLRMSRRHPARADDPFWSELDRWTREEVAAAAQAVLEDAAVDFARHWIQRTQCPHLALAGGVFANVKVNQRLAALPEVESLWVMPHMGDGGLAVGGALASAGTPPLALPTACLGPALSGSDVYQALGNAELPRDRAGGDVVGAVAALLLAGKVVARCCGRMEWGPRALGNRSILALPTDPALNETLNDRLQRTAFMPFAPIVREEDAERWFVGIDKARQAARFMTVSFPTTAKFQRLCPAAVHVDGTARPQLLRPQDSPALHDLLTRIGERTGAAVLINTSFNMHEEPIVCTASDAVRAWKRSGLDGLWLGDYLVRATG